MITIISGTNRAGSYSLKVANEYQRILAEKGVKSQVFTLEGVNVLERDAAFQEIENKIIVPTKTFIFISPEYNGSFPGVLKMLFDTGVSHKIWWHKKALLTGVATGRAGNLRGMDHLSAVLNHVKVTVHPFQLPISNVDKLMDESGRFTHEPTINTINQQLDDFLKWI
jgi:chromate reductase, NAD(P)H dehydrogenase (quinone)